MKSLLPLALLFATACQIPAPTYVQPVDAARSTFKIVIQELAEGGVLDLGSGTAWVVKNESDHSVLVTAGHVCDTNNYTLVAADGTKTPAFLVRKHETYDLCTVEALHIVGPPLPIAPQDPVLYQGVFYVGAPNGVYGCDEEAVCGYQPMYRGHYAGNDLITAPAFGGSSGSAILTEEGVVGVLVSGYRNFPHLIFMEPRSHLVEFLTAAGR